MSLFLSYGAVNFEPVVIRYFTNKYTSGDAAILVKGPHSEVEISLSEVEETSTLLGSW